MSPRSSIQSHTSGVILLNIRWLARVIVSWNAAIKPSFLRIAPFFTFHRARAYLRHVLEVRQRILEGMNSSQIEHDPRRNDESIECSLKSVSIGVRSIIHTLDTRGTGRSILLF